MAKWSFSSLFSVELSIKIYTNVQLFHSTKKHDFISGPNKIIYWYFLQLGYSVICRIAKTKIAQQNIPSA